MWSIIIVQCTDRKASPQILNSNRRCLKIYINYVCLYVKLNSYYWYKKVIKQGTDPVVTTLRLSKYQLLYMHVRMYVNLKLNDKNMEPSPDPAK